jgi:hypothetical protein
MIGSVAELWKLLADTLSRKIRPAVGTNDQSLLAKIR